MNFLKMIASSYAEMTGKNPFSWQGREIAAPQKMFKPHPEWTEILDLMEADAFTCSKVKFPVFTTDGYMTGQSSPSCVSLTFHTKGRNSFSHVETYEESTPVELMTKFADWMRQNGVSLMRENGFLNFRVKKGCQPKWEEIVDVTKQAMVIRLLKLELEKNPEVKSRLDAKKGEAVSELDRRFPEHLRGQARAELESERLMEKAVATSVAKPPRKGM